VTSAVEWNHLSSQLLCVVSPQFVGHALQASTRARSIAMSQVNPHPLPLDVAAMASAPPSAINVEETKIASSRFFISILKVLPVV
jgi:hypothetical protein